MQSRILFAVVAAAVTLGGACSSVAQKATLPSRRRSGIQSNLQFIPSLWDGIS